MRRSTARVRRAAASSTAGLVLWPLLLAATTLAQSSMLPPLAPAAAAGWRRYVAAVEAGHARERPGPAGRLLLPEHLDPVRARHRILAGEVLVAPVPAPAPGLLAELEGARIHHWHGAVFVPGTTVDTLVDALEHAPPRAADVLEARVVRRDADGLQVRLRLRRTQVVSVVYDTEHRVRFERIAQGLARSTSRAVHLVEVADAGSPRERALSWDADHDFVWRLHAYWRYQAAPGGVLVECESLTLSRAVPTGLGLIAAPIIRRAAESSMQAALVAVRDVGLSRGGTPVARRRPTPPPSSPGR